MSLPVLVIFIGALAAAGALIAAFAGNGAQAGLRKRAKALNRAMAGVPTKPTAGRSPANSVKRTEARALPLLEALARRLMPRQDAIRDRLARTGYSIAPSSYVTACLAIAAATGGAIFLTTGMLPLAGLVGVVAGAGLPHFAIGFLGNRRRARFVAQLPEAIDLIVRGLKSGLPVTESMATVGRELTAPIGPEFSRISDSVRFGQPLDDAIGEAAARLQTPEFNFFVISLSIQRETGGNLGETLGNLSDIIRRRRHMRLKIKAMSSEAKSSAIILGSLPFALCGIIGVMSPDYIAVLYTDPRGMILAGAGLLSIGIGIGIMAKLIRFEI
jgi:tight adherence protein B